MYKMKDVEVDLVLKSKYYVQSYQQLEDLLLDKISSVQMIDNSHARCELLLDLANVYLHCNKRTQALQMLEQADTLILEYAYSEFLSAVYLLRAHLALLHNDWMMIHELCALGITAASKFKRYDHIACFYLIWTQMALNDEMYEKAIIFGKLVIHFVSKFKDGIPNFLVVVSLFLVQAYIALQKEEEAQQILNKLAAKRELPTISQLYTTVANVFYAWVKSGEVVYEEQLHDLLEQLWKRGQFAEVKTILAVMMKYNPLLYATHAQLVMYTRAFELDEEMIRWIERLDYHDQIRAVQITNGNDEKIGYHTGKSFRKLLQQKIAAASEEQFITIVAFVIRVNDSDLLDRHLKVKYDYYIKIDQDFSQFYPESTRGKYYPSSFCTLFITDEPLNIREVVGKCKAYLDNIQLVLEDQPIYYSIHMGASSVQKKAFKSLQALYQEADKSLYYAKVTKQPLVVYGEE